MNVTQNDPRPFIHHLYLAMKWGQANGKKNTAAQLSRIMGRFDADTLARMLAERGVRVES